MAVIILARYTFRDQQGRTAVLKFWGTSSTEALWAGGVANIKTALQAVSTAFVASNLDGPAPLTYGGSATYNSAQDKAELVFEDTLGGIHRLQIPCPQGNSTTNVFQPDGLTVNAGTGTVMATLVGELQGFACTRAGNLFATYVGGIRIRKKLPRRTSINVLSPTDVGPEE